MRVVWTLAIAAFLVVPAGEAAAGMITGQAEVVDGDGLLIGPVRIRLNGIDAPELGQHCAKRGGGNWPCDEAAADRLEQLITGKEVACEPIDRDPYGRVIAHCTADGVDLARTLAAEGLVWAFRRYSTDYTATEDQVHAAGVGIWQAETQPPWEFRADRWERAVEAAPNGCPIKGNISSEGERIYHTPWSPWYGRTKISEANGERWFCDESQAIQGKPPPKAAVQVFSVLARRTLAAFRRAAILPSAYLIGSSSIMSGS